MSDEADPPPQVGFDGKDTVWLAKPVTAYGDRIDKLVFRTPNAKDMRLCGGLPFKLFTENDRQYQAIDQQTVFNYAVRLANVPASTLDSLSVRDMNAVTEAVSHFFAEEASPSTSSTDTTMSPGDGVAVLKPSSPSTSMSSLSLSDRRSA